MFEPGQTKPLPGYMGHIRGNWKEEEVQTRTQARGHIPNYAGFIRGAKAENFIGQTYGKMTYVSSTGEYPKGRDFAPDEKYKSVARDQHVDVNKIEEKKASEILGVEQIPEEKPTIVPVDQYNKFWGVKDDTDVSLTKNSLAFYQGMGARQETEEGQQLDQAEKVFFGQQVQKVKPVRHGEPLPGYTGVSRRVGADNIFGQSYAASRKTAKQVLKDHKVEKADNLKQRAAFVPDYMKTDIGDYDAFLDQLKPSQLERAEPVVEEQKQVQEPRLSSAEVRAFYGETDNDE